MEGWLIIIGLSLHVSCQGRVHLSKLRHSLGQFILIHANACVGYSENVCISWAELSLINESTETMANGTMPTINNAAISFAFIDRSNLIWIGNGSSLIASFREL